MATDWTPLDEGDPLPGDPSGVSELAGLLAADAAELRTVIDGLHEVDTCEIWSGENADRFVDAKDKAVPDLELVAKRMEDASRALNRFVPGMANSQALARTALFRARDAGERMDRANAALDEEDRRRKAAEAAASGPAGFRNVTQVTLGPSWTGMRDEANDDLDAARRLFAVACKDYRDAASTCAHDLGQAIDDHLKDHHSHGLLGGIGHGFSTGVHAIAHGVSVAASWTADHFPTLDTISEGLGVAAAIASLTGCEPLALALTSAKTTIDLGEYLATGKGGDKLRDDAIGFAAFGAVKVLTGVARGRVAVGAAERAERVREKISALKAERDAAQDASQLRTIAASVREQRTQFQSLNAVATKFAEDAPGHFWTRSLRTITAKEAELPALKELTLSRSALAVAGTGKGIDLYGKFKDLNEIHTKADEWSGPHEILASEGRP